VEINGSLSGGGKQKKKLEVGKDGREITEGTARKYQDFDTRSEGSCDTPMS